MEHRSRMTLAVATLLLCLLCSGNAAKVWHGVAESDGWRGCVVRVNIAGETTMELEGVVDLGGDPSPKFAMDQEISPSVVGSIHVGLEFGGQERTADAKECNALVEDKGAPITGVRILSEDTGDGLQPSPIHVTPNPATLQVYTSTVKNLAKVKIYNASLFLEDSGPGTLQPKSDGVFSGPVTARMVSATVGVTSALPVLPPMQASLPDEGGESLQLTADQELAVTRVFSDGGVELRVEMPNMSYEASTTYSSLGVEATVTARLLASSDEPCEAPLQRSLVDGACGCHEGLTGASCAVCTASSGCSGNEVCDTSFEYSESTSTKGLTCEAATGSGLEGILTVLEMQCSPSGPLPSELSAPDADPSAGFCEMQVGLNIGFPINLECHAYNCSMAAGSSNTNCSGAICSCPGGCNGMDMFAQTIRSAAMTCDASTGSCSLSISGLPEGFNSFEVLCGAGECLEGSQQQPGVAAVPKEVPVPDREISTSPGAASSPPPALPGFAVVVPDPDALEGCGGVKIWDTRTQSCVCPPGLSGSTCGVCSTDASCRVPGAACDTSFNFTSTTASKAFVCSSTNPMISEAVEQVDFQCSTNTDAPPQILSNASSLIDTSLSFCDVQVRVALGLNPIDVECAAYNCAIPLNESSVSCGGVLCDCVGDDCATFKSLVDGISDVAFGCSDSGDCSINIGGLPFSNLAVECGAGECVAPDAAGSFTGSRIPDSEPDWQRIGIAVVGFLPTAVMLVLLLFVFLLARASQTCGRRASSSAAADALVGTPLASKRIKTLSFEGLTVTVPQQRTNNPGEGKQQQGPSSAGPMAEALEDSEERELEIMEGQPVSEAIMPPQGSERDASTGQLLPATANDAAVDADDTLGANSSYGEVAVQPMPDDVLHEGKRCILSRVSCTAMRGEVLAIMGPSGSGKTTLLSILAAREGDLGTGARVKGSVLVDGAKRRQRNFRSACAYVAQDDALFPSLTVRESVYYSAKLRMPERSLSDLDRLTDETLSELRLSHVASVRVGSSAAGSGGRGVSGGERRRVSIAMEMVTQPSIIMLDEPTSGLDSFAAGALMSSLRDIAQGGRVVILTLHQPSPTAFYQLDKVLLLARGRRVFSGSPLEVEEFFSAPNFPVEHGMPIADHMLQVVSEPTNLARALAMTEHGNNKPHNALSPLCAGSVANGMDESCKDNMSAAAAAVSKSPGSADRVVAWLLEMDMLLWRGFTNLYRTPTLLLLHSIVAIFMGLGMGVVYLGVDDSLTGLQNKAGGIFFALAFFAFCSLTTVDTFLTERTTVLREIQGGYYSAASYLLVKVMLDSLLLRVLPAVLFSFPFYFLMGLSREPPRIAVWFAVLSTFSATAGALSLAVSIGCRTAGTANLVMTMVLLISLVFGGFLANLEDMPSWVSWISYGSIFRYSFNALVVNEVVGTSFDLSVSGYDIDGMDSELLLDVLGLNKDAFGRDVAILDILFVGFLMIAVLVLYLILPRHGSRRSRGSKKAVEAKKASMGGNGQQDAVADDRPAHILADESVELSVLDP